MKSELFYKRQRFGNFLYRFILIAVIFSILIGVLGIVATLFSSSHSPNDKLISWILFPFTIIFFICLFIYVIKSFGKERKQLYKQYEQLSDSEKQMINSEIKDGYKGALCGQERLYYNHRGFMHFINYVDMAWIYQQNNKMPILMDAGNNMALESSYTTSQLIMYTRLGKRIAAETGIYTSAVLSDIKDHVPDIIFGYSKERYKLAKRDFDKFVYEYMTIEK